MSVGFISVREDKFNIRNDWHNPIVSNCDDENTSTTVTGVTTLPFFLLSETSLDVPICHMLVSNEAAEEHPWPKGCSVLCYAARSCCYILVQTLSQRRSAMDRILAYRITWDKNSSQKDIWYCILSNSHTHQKLWLGNPKAGLHRCAWGRARHSRMPL